MNRRVSFGSLVLLFAAAACVYAQQGFSGRPEIKSVTVSPISFNPSKGETASLGYQLAGPAKVRICVYDADNGLIRELVAWAPRDAGTNGDKWDGRDKSGAIVPDEAYFFTIEAGDKTGKVHVFDPTTFSGGDEIEIAGVTYDRQAGVARFQLDRPSRVLVRAGISGGPLIKTLIDWVALSPSAQSVSWDGKDEDDIAEVGQRDDLKFYAIGFLLPQASVIATGNSLTDYSAYKRQIGRQQPLKPERPSQTRRVPISDHWERLRYEDRAIRLSVRPVGNVELSPAGAAIVSGTCKALVEVHADDLPGLRRDRYEVIAYVDMLPLVEGEQGRSPYTLDWDTSKLAPGEHILTINVATASDRVGTTSMKVLVR